MQPTNTNQTSSTSLPNTNIGSTSSPTPTSVYNPSPIPSPSTTGTTQPQIPAGTLNTPSYNAPTGVNNATTPTQQATQKSNAAINSYVDYANNQVNTAQQNYENSQNSETGLLNTYMGKGQDQLNMEQNMGVNDMRSNAAMLNKEYQAAQVNLNNQYQAIYNNSGMTQSQQQSAINSVNHQNALDVSTIGIKASLAQTDYDNAENIIQHQIDIKYAPIKDAADSMLQIASNNKDIFNTSQTNAITAMGQAASQQYNMSTYYAKLNGDTSMDMLKTASNNGAPQDIIQKMNSTIASGGSAADVAQIASGYITNGNYSVAYNPISGNLEPFNATTGKFSDGTDMPGNAATYDPTTDGGTYTASDGSKYNFSSYATDPNYVPKVMAATSTISTQFGAVTSADTAQSVINQLAPTSSLTGSMVYSAANNAGINPTDMLGQMQVESQLGQSHVAQADNNFGGLTYSGQNTYMGVPVTQGSARPSSEGGYYMHFANAQDGVTAMAKFIASKKQPPSITAPGQNADTQTKINFVTSLKQSLPAYIGKAVNYMSSTGDGYIDASLLTDPTGAPNNVALNAAASLEKNYGIKVLPHDEVLSLQSADTALTNINNIQDAWNKVASKGTVSGWWNGITNPLNVAAHTQAASDIKGYLNLAPSAISTLNAITDSNRLSNFTATLSTDSLPILPGYTTDPNNKMNFDTLEEGNIKLDNLKKDINASITPILPSSSGSPLSTDFVTIQTPNGSTGQIPKSNLTKAITLGAKQI